MKAIPKKELIDLVKEMMKEEKGDGISELDRAYKRGWRDACRLFRKVIDERIDGDSQP